MAKIYDDPSTTENEDELFNGGGNNDVSMKTILGVVGLVLFILMPLPILLGLVITWSVWAVFRWVHIRASVLTMFAAIGAALSLLMMTITFKFSELPALIARLTARNAGGFGARVMIWIHGTAGLIWLGVAIGLLAGAACSWFTRSRIHNNPYLVVTKGEKYFHWRYKRTPRQLLNRYLTIKSMKADAYNVKAGFALGIEEEPINPPDDPAYIKYDIPIGRYNSEAFTHTIITGASGSGKSARWDTLIPTLYGMKLMKDIKVGDILFDENGNHTTVLAKYHPRTPDHYAVSFSDGTVINVCGDHLWQVNLVGKRKRTGRSLVSMYTDDQLAELHRIYDAINDDNACITTEQAVDEYGSWIKGNKSIQCYNDALKNLEFNKPLYDRDELRAKVSGTSRMSSSKKNEIIAYINDDRNLVNGNYIRHEALFNIVGNACVLVDLTRYIHDRTYSSYNKKAYFHALISAEETRRARIECNQSLDVNMLQSEVLDTRTMYANIANNRSSGKLYSVSATKCVDYPEQELPVQPYALGAWLGDGCSYNAILQTSAGKIIKDIPDIYLIASKRQRMALLAGLLDTDGTVSKSGRVEVNMTDENVVRKMRGIVCSLGWIPTRITVRKNHYSNANNERIDCKVSYRFAFHPDEQVFTVRRKAERLQRRLDSLKQQARNSQRYIDGIVRIDDGNQDYYCLTVDSPNHLFLCSDSYVPTHNTITMQNDIYHKMQEKQTLFIIDCKADPNFAGKMASWCNDLGLNFYHFAPTMGNEYRISQNPSGPAFYDPLSHGRSAEHTDMLISTREWDAASAVYKSNAQSMLSTVFAIMDEMDKNDPSLKNIDFTRGNMYTFYELIRNEGNLASAINTVPSSSNTRLLADELETLIHATNRQREAQGVQNAMGEYKGFMRGLMSSDGKYMVYPGAGANRKIIDIFKLASEPGNVVLFSISATKATDVGAMVGSMICTDLTNMTAMRAISGQTNPVSIYVDEFQSLPPTSVKSMLEKARSARIGITLAFQSLDQVTASAGSDAFINALLDTCGNFIFHAGANETTAQQMSQIIGKHWTNSYMIQRRNQQGMFELNFGNKRNANVMTSQIEKYIIEPSAFQHLSAPRRENGFKSEAIVIKKASSDAVDSGIAGAVAHKVWMIPPSDIIADDYFDPNAPIMQFDDRPPSTGLEDDDTDNAGNAYTATRNGDMDMKLFNNSVAVQAARKAEVRSPQPMQSTVSGIDDSLFSPEPASGPVSMPAPAHRGPGRPKKNQQSSSEPDMPSAPSSSADDMDPLFSDDNASKPSIQMVRKEQQPRQQRRVSDVSNMPKERQERAHRALGNKSGINGSDMTGRLRRAPSQRSQGAPQRLQPQRRASNAPVSNESMNPDALFNDNAARRESPQRIQETPRSSGRTAKQVTAPGRRKKPVAPGRR